MRRDLFITALIFAAVGFVAGHVYSDRTREANAPIALQQPGTFGASGQDLPQGHPPIDQAQRWLALEQQAEANPGDPRTLLELANFLYDIQRWEQAVLWYGRALKLEPANADARTDLATSNFHLGHIDEAIAGYTRALEDESNKPQALYGLALARLRGKQDRRGAREAYEQLRRHHPDFPRLQQLAQELEAGQPRP